MVAVREPTLKAVEFDLAQYGNEAKPYFFENPGGPTARTFCQRAA